MSRFYFLTRRRSIILIVVAMLTLVLMALPAWTGNREPLSAMLNIPISRLPWSEQDRAESKLLAVDPDLVPLFGQRDPRWAEDQLGGCPTSRMGARGNSYGCFVTSKAMLYNYYQPGFTTPGQLNEYLANHGGYCVDTSCSSTGGCLMRWETTGAQAIGGPSGVTAQGAMWGDPTENSEVRNRVNSELSQGYPVLAWVWGAGMSSHMVVLTAPDGNTYRINDPEHSPYGVRAKLSDYGYHVRTVRFYHGPVPGQTEPVLNVRALLPHYYSNDHACNLTLRLRNVGSYNVVATYIIPMDSQGQHNGLRLDGVASGTYDITASTSYRLVKRVTQFLRPGSNTVDFGTLVGGDANNDNVINALDVSLLLNDFYTANPRSDVNGDGIINSLDYAMLVSNYWMEGDEFGTMQASVAQPTTGRVGRVWINPASTAHSVGNTFTLQVMLDTGGAEVNAVNVTLKFDPGVLHYRWTSGSLSPFTYTFGEDLAKGEIKIGAYVCAGCGPFWGTGTLARVQFDVLSSIGSSSVATDFQLGSTTDSNLAEYATAADVLGSVGGTALALSGAPARPMPTGQIVIPWEGSMLDHGPVDIRVNAHDPYNQLQRVDFESYFREDFSSPLTWHYIGSDTDGHDGWSLVTDRTRIMWQEAFQFRARLVLNSGQSVQTSAVNVERVVGDLIRDEIIVRPKSGEDLYEIVARHGGEASDVECSYSCCTVRVPWPMPVDGLFLMLSEYSDDPDVEWAEPNTIFHTLDWGEIPQGLMRGWNLISLTVHPDIGDISSLLAPIAGLYDQVLIYDASNPTSPWRGYDPDRPTYANSLNQIDETMGIWLHMLDSAELSVSGTLPDSVSIPLHTGWNLIGFPSSKSLPLEDALASIAGKYTHVATYIAEQSEDPWKEYDSSWPSPDNTLTTMNPGRGYLILVTQDCTLLIDNPEPPW